MEKQMKMQQLITKRVTFLAALCMALSLVELAIPKPLPFMRLGLANLPLLLGLGFLTTGQYFVLVVLKICLQALVSGTFFSYVFLFSIGGTMSSAVVMYVFYRLFKKTMSFIGVSTAGSMANAAVQYGLSLVVLFGEGAAYIAPLLFGSAFITGILLGVVANYCIHHSAFLARFATEEHDVDLQNSTADSVPPSDTKHAVWHEVLRLAVFAAGIIVLCFVKNTWIAVSVMILAFITVFIVRRRNGKRVRIMQSVFIFTSVLLFALLVPGGKVLFSIGKWRITQGALFSGIRRASILLGSVFLSQLAFSKDIRLSGSLGVAVSQIFSYFGHITEAVPKKTEKIKGRNRLKEYFASLDDHLTSVYYG